MPGAGTRYAAFVDGFSSATGRGIGAEGRCGGSRRRDQRTHDLAALGQAIVDGGQGLPVSIDELRAFNPFAVEFRYDDEIEPSMTRPGAAI